MNIRFDRAVEVTLVREGVFSERKDDPGGETVCGIARATHGAKTSFWELVAKWQAGNASFEMVREAAKGIYYTEYWSPYITEDVSWCIAYPFFDRIVNQSPKTVVTAFQQAMGLIADGEFGPKTQQAMADLGSRDGGTRREKIALFMAGCMDKFVDIPTLEWAEKGVLKRTYLVMAEAFAPPAGFR